MSTDLAPPRITAPAPQIPATRWRPWLTLANLYVLVAMAAVLGAAMATVVSPHDYWWHLATGRHIAMQHAVPTTDLFSFTRAGEPFFNQHWLAQLVMYGLHRLGGVPLVVMGHAVVITAAYALLLRLCLGISADKRRAAVVLLVAVLPLSYPNWAVRPQPYAFPLFVAFLTILHRHRTNQPATEGAGRGRAASLLALPALMAVWVNVHGSFVLGIGLLGLTLLGELLARRLTPEQALSRQAWWQLAAASAATAAATLVNPRGWEVLGYVWRLVTSPTVSQQVAEWAPTLPVDVTGVLFYVVVVTSVAVVARVWRRIHVTDALVFATFLALAVDSGRNTIWFALILAPVLVSALAGLHRGDRTTVHPGSAAVNAVFAAVVVSAVVLASPWVRDALVPGRAGDLVDAVHTPVAAASHLSALEHRPARMFAELGFSSYLTWAVPGQRTFVDPRFELFTAEQFDDYRRLSAGEEIAELTEKYELDAFLVSPVEQPALVERLRGDPAWRLQYRDPTAVLFLPAIRR